MIRTRDLSVDILEEAARTALRTQEFLRSQFGLGVGRVKLSKGDILKRLRTSSPDDQTALLDILSERGGL